MPTFPIKGVKWFKDIIRDDMRQYGIEVHNHLPSKIIDVPPYGKDTAIIRLPEQQKLIEELEIYFGGTTRKQIIPDAYAATIENATIVGNSGMIFTPDGYIIAETASMTGTGDGRCFTIENVFNPSFKPCYRGHFDGKLLSIANPNGGYAHHLKESFFSLLWFNDHKMDAIHVHEGRNAERMKEFVRDFGISTEHFCIGKKTELISADKVSFFAPCAFILYRKETASMVQKTLIAPRVDKTIVPHKKVYFINGAKSGGAHRKAINAEKLESYLQDVGFEMIDPATMTTPEKIDYLQHVDTVLTLYGSASANLAFSANGSLKHINLPRPQSMIIGNIMGTNHLLPMYTQSDISPIYGQLCHANGYLMTAIHTGWSYNIEKLTAQFFPILPEKFSNSNSYEIKMDKFEEFYEHYIKQVKLRGL